MNNKVLLLGCGNLGSLLVASWMKNNFEITVLEKNKNSIKSLKKKFKRHLFETTLDNIMISEYSIIILCVKPIHSISLIRKVSKSIGSSSPYNMVRATFNGLQNIQSPRGIAARRGLKVSNIFGKNKTDKKQELNKNDQTKDNKS